MHLYNYLALLKFAISTCSFSCYRNKQEDFISVENYYMALCAFPEISRGGVFTLKIARPDDNSAVVSIHDRSCEVVRKIYRQPHSYSPPNQCGKSKMLERFLLAIAKNVLFTKAGNPRFIRADDSASHYARQTKVSVCWLNAVVMIFFD